MVLYPRMFLYLPNALCFHNQKMVAFLGGLSHCITNDLHVRGGSLYVREVISLQSYTDSHRSAWIRYLVLLHTDPFNITDHIIAINQDSICIIDSCEAYHSHVCWCIIWVIHKSHVSLQSHAISRKSRVKVESYVGWHFHNPKNVFI